MKREPVIAIFDVGKTNKKLLLFNQDYKIVYEKSARFIETVDEDGFPCENLDALKQSLFDSLKEVSRSKDYEVVAINFSTYGASFVYIDEHGDPLTPLYNYLKPYPPELQKTFYETFGGEQEFARETASPISGSLNSGMQLYRLKHQQPEIFKKVRYALHLPQYMSYLMTREAFSDITSIGCHTGLWNFDLHKYHKWLFDEHVIDKLAPLTPIIKVVESQEGTKGPVIGIGLHDSSAALIPYTTNFHEPFMLLSTGTWCISLNPFNHSPLTTAELRQDCLCYLDQKGKPIKASRLFAGHEHEVQTKKIAEHFKVDGLKYKTLPYTHKHILRLNLDKKLTDKKGLKPFDPANLDNYFSDEEAYHHLIYSLVQQQIKSSMLVLKDTDTPVKRVFVDGGFSRNAVYMTLLASMFKGVEVFAASMPQATAMGAALAIHKSWNKKALPNNLIELNYYSGTII
jgi:sugar (pentulose or hexulose) kinase